MSTRVLILEDEADLADLVTLHLEREGLSVAAFPDGTSGLKAIERELPDLVVLDLMLPGLDGFEVCRRMRAGESTTDIPVLIVSARGEESDIVTGLELGADDYIVKPFSPRELVARARALLRRRSTGGGSTEAMGLGPIRIDTDRHEVFLDDDPLFLTYTEFLVLAYLARKPGRVRSRGEILEAIGEKHVLERTVDVHVASLRKKLGAAGEWIETVRGMGYRAKDG